MKYFFSSQKVSFNFIFMTSSDDEIVLNNNGTIQRVIFYNKFQSFSIQEFQLISEFKIWCKINKKDIP